MNFDGSNQAARRHRKGRHQERPERTLCFEVDINANKTRSARLSRSSSKLKCPIKPAPPPQAGGVEIRRVSSD
jgi:hypothetical protein